MSGKETRGTRCWIMRDSRCCSHFLLQLHHITGPSIQLIPGSKFLGHILVTDAVLRDTPGLREGLLQGLLEGVRPVLEGFVLFEILPAVLQFGNSCRDVRVSAGGGQMRVEGKGRNKRNKISIKHVVQNRRQRPMVGGRNNKMLQASGCQGMILMTGRNKDVNPLKHEAS